MTACKRGRRPQLEEVLTASAELGEPQAPCQHSNELQNTARLSNELTAQLDSMPDRPAVPSSDLSLGDVQNPYLGSLGLHL